MKTIAPYGSWSSDVSAEYVAGKERSLSLSLQVDAEDIYFLENRPDEKGRVVLMCLEKSGHIYEPLPAEFNMRTRYLEYGGKCFLVCERVLYFVNFSDQRIYVASKGHVPRALTSLAEQRFADFIIDKERNRLVALREVAAKPEARNSVCVIDLSTGEVSDLVTGDDFYSCPRLSFDGKKLLWICWKHPNMPWNGTELWEGELDSFGKVIRKQKISGDSEHGICQAQFSEQGDIFFVGELGEWFNLHRYSGGRVENVLPVEAESAYAEWTPGNQQYAIRKNGDICALSLIKGHAQIVKVSKGQVQSVGLPYATLGSFCAFQDGFVATVGFSTQSYQIVKIDSQGQVVKLYESPTKKLELENISVSEQIEFQAEDGSTGYAWYYPPQNKGYAGATYEKPPLIVKCHGGPTSMALAEFNKSIQFWTSRGYAVVDVNYGGSTGYGRKYRERLRGNWGVVDVSDCVAVVKQLAHEEKIDSNRVAIRGGSAGGFTTLAALAFTKGIFSVGASYFGVSDLEMLAMETHKFESRYLDQLVGPYPEAIAVYKKRAPIEHVQSLNCPIIFFQGDEDKVVPPNQSELMHESLKKKGIPTEYHLYAGEGHGFRSSENIQHSLRAEHNFYARFFNFSVQAQDKL